MPDWAVFARSSLLGRSPVNYSHLDEDVASAANIPPISQEPIHSLRSPLAKLMNGLRAAIVAEQKAT
jgi:hypothetical protein